MNTISTATFQFDTTGSGLPDSVKKAIYYAGKIWSYLIKSDQIIKIRVRWQALGSGTLAVTKGDSIHYFLSNPSKPNIAYPSALAEAMSNQNLSGGYSDAVIDLNKSITWYCDTVGNCPANKYDLVTVMMHEIGHGLGFLPSLNVAENGVGSWGITIGGVKRPTIYDSSCVYGPSRYRLTNTSSYANPSPALGSALKSNAIYFDENNSNIMNNYLPPKLYAPSEWAGGSSISHLDESSFPHGNSNSLMTYELDMAEAIHSPGEIGLAMLKDMGWEINRIVTFTSPSGGERWAQGETYQIKWTDNKYSSVLIKLYKKNEQLGTFDDVLTLGTFPSNIGMTNLQNWVVPTNLTNGIYRFRVQMLSGEGLGLSNVFTISNQVATPVFSPQGGIYSEPKAVFISCATPGASIYYTDNGDTPSQSSIPYTNNPITVDTDKTLKAIAYRTGFTTSEVGSATYIIGTTGGNLLTVGPGRWNESRSAIQYKVNTDTLYTYGQNQIGTGDFIAGNAINEKARVVLQWNIPDNFIPDDAEIIQAELQVAISDKSSPPLLKFLSIPIQNISNNDWNAIWNSPTGGVEVQTGVDFSSSSYWQNSYAKGSAFVNSLQQRLTNNKFQLVLVSQAEGVNNKWVKIDLMNTYLTIWFRPPSRLVTFRNNLSGTHNVGQIKVDGVWQESPFTQPYRWGTNLQIEATAERLNHANDNWKFRKWNDNGSAQIVRNIKIENNFLYQADCERVFTITLRNDFEGTTGGQLIYQGNQVNTGYTTEDIFNATNRNFSAITPQTNGGITWNFYTWDDGITTPNRNVTVTSTKEFKAKFKSHLTSNSSSVLSSNAQRKLVSSEDGITMLLVYESGGHIWYTKSINGGTNWSAEEIVSSLSDGINSSPSVCIDNFTNNLYIVWHWAKDGSPSKVFMRKKSNTGWSAISTVSNNVTTNSQPVISIITLKLGKPPDYTFYRRLMSAHQSSFGWITVKESDDGGTSWADRGLYQGYDPTISPPRALNNYNIGIIDLSFQRQGKIYTDRYQADVCVIGPGFGSHSGSSFILYQADVCVIGPPDPKNEINEERIPPDFCANWTGVITVPGSVNVNYFSEKPQTISTSYELLNTWEMSPFFNCEDPIPGPVDLKTSEEEMNITENIDEIMQKIPSPGGCYRPPPRIGFQRFSFAGWLTSRYFSGANFRNPSISHLSTNRVILSWDDGSRIWRTTSTNGGSDWASPSQVEFGTSPNLSVSGGLEQAMQSKYVYRSGSGALHHLNMQSGAFAKEAELTNYKSRSISIEDTSNKASIYFEFSPLILKTTKGILQKIPLLQVSDTLTGFSLRNILRTLSTNSITFPKDVDSIFLNVTLATKRAWVFTEKSKSKFHLLLKLKSQKAGESNYNILGLSFKDNHFLHTRLAIPAKLLRGRTLYFEPSFEFLNNDIQNIVMDFGNIYNFDDNKHEFKEMLKTSDDLPSEYKLNQNYPNPFNPTTVVNYQLPIDNWVTLKVYDVLGREVATLVDEFKSAGYYEVSLNAEQLSSGVYFYRFVSGNYTAVKKLLITK